MNIVILRLVCTRVFFGYIVHILYMQYIRTFTTIGNNSEWLHFKDDTLIFQNLPKNQKSVEKSSRKICSKIISNNNFENFEIFEKPKNYNTMSYYDFLIFRKITQNTGNFGNLYF